MFWADFLGGRHEVHVTGVPRQIEIVAAGIGRGNRRRKRFERKSGHRTLTHVFASRNSSGQTLSDCTAVVPNRRLLINFRIHSGFGETPRTAVTTCYPPGSSFEHSTMSRSLAIVKHVEVLQRFA